MAVLQCLPGGLTFWQILSTQKEECIDEILVDWQSKSVRQENCDLTIGIKSEKNMKRTKIIKLKGNLKHQTLCWCKNKKKI